MADGVYTRGIPEWAAWSTGTYKVLLLKTGYTFNKDHDFVADLTPASFETVATDYVRKTVASKTVTVDDTNDRVAYDAADLTWTGLGGATNETIVAAVLYREVTNDADSILLMYYDLVDTLTTNTDFTVQWGANGLALFRAA